MRKLIMQQWISLDGYIAGPNGELDFFTSFTTTENKYSDHDQLRMLEERVDTMILGRNTYDIFVSFWPTEESKQEVISGKLNSLNKVIFSNTMKAAPWGEWPAGKVASGNAADNVKRLKSMQGKDIVLWGSISLSQALMKEDLIDEYHLQVCPIILGTGRALFLNGQSTKNLKFKTSRTYDTGVTHLQFERK